MINKSRKDSPECGDKPIAGEFVVLGEGDLVRTPGVLLNL